jgi:hypothetical protein
MPKIYVRYSTDFGTVLDILEGKMGGVLHKNKVHEMSLTA